MRLCSEYYVVKPSFKSNVVLYVRFRIESNENATINAFMNSTFYSLSENLSFLCFFNDTADSYFTTVYHLWTMIGMFFFSNLIWFCIITLSSFFFIFNISHVIRDERSIYRLCWCIEENETGWKIFWWNYHQYANNAVYDYIEPLWSLSYILHGIKFIAFYAIQFSINYYFITI